MSFKLHRLDAQYEALFVAPALSLAGDVPRIIRGAFEAVVSRYPGVRTDAFRAVNSNTLSEVGIAISLLDKRLEITLRVDRLQVQGTNLRHAEVAFSQDIVLLMHSFIDAALPETQGSFANLKIASWLNVEGGKKATEKALNTVARPAKSLFDKKLVGAADLQYNAKFRLSNESQGWHIIVTAEFSAIEGADLYLFRDYAFTITPEFSTTEARLAFVQKSTVAIAEWLGIGPYDEG
jgi:hypothetical protein